MKYFLKKLAAVILTTMFVINIIPTGAYAARLDVCEIEPRDSGGFIYQYYTTLPSGWPAPVADKNGWTGWREDEGIILAKKVRDHTVGELRSKIVRRIPGISGKVAEKMAEEIINKAIEQSLMVFNISISLTYLRNDNRRPLQYLYYYSYTYTLGSSIWSGTQYELATLN